MNGPKTTPKDILNARESWLPDRKFGREYRALRVQSGVVGRERFELSTYGTTAESKLAQAPSK
jgi:hypothetical protein